MKLIEFFSSIQGEGNTQGKASWFLRFPNCNLFCKECDSKYSWSDKNSTEYKFEDVYEKLRNSSIKNIVFTGGEPLLSENLKEIIYLIATFSYSRTFEIETNGTIDLPDDILNFLYNNYVQLNISPKGNFEMEKMVNTFPKLIRCKSKEYNNYIVKFLFNSEEDLKFIKNFELQYKIPSNKIWLQPKGIDEKTIKELITKYFDEIINNGWNISLRSHIFLFGNERCK